MSGPVSPRQAQIEAFLATELRNEQRRKVLMECERFGHIYADHDTVCVRCGEQDPYEDDIPF